MIEKHYVSIVALYFLFVCYGISGSHKLNSLLVLFKENSILINKEHQENISNTSLRILVNYNSSVTADQLKL